MSRFPRLSPPGIFDWELKLALGSLAQTYTGIGSPLTDFITFSGDTNRFDSNSPGTNQIITGGITPPQDALFIAIKI
jgi:hypothetical protein